MNNLPSDALVRAKDALAIKKHLIEQRLRLFEREQQDGDNVLPQPVELGAYSWSVDVQTNREVLKTELQKLLGSVEETLKRLEEGSYGICHTCGKKIEAARLRLIPTTFLCIACM